MRNQAACGIGTIALTICMLLAGITPETRAQQKDLPEVTLLTAVPNFAFAAIWVAEQLKYFEQEAVRIKITPPPTGSAFLNPGVGPSTNFSASPPEGLFLPRAEAAPAMALQPT